MAIALLFITMLFGSASTYAFLEGHLIFGVICGFIALISLSVLISRMIKRVRSPYDCVDCEDGDFGSSRGGDSDSDGGFFGGFGGGDGGGSGGGGGGGGD